jgi:hypothetical protein
MRSARVELVLWAIAGVLLGVLVLALFDESQRHRYGSMVETAWNPLGM